MFGEQSKARFAAFGIKAQLTYLLRDWVIWARIGVFAGLFCRQAQVISQDAHWRSFHSAPRDELDLVRNILCHVDDFFAFICGEENRKRCFLGFDIIDIFRITPDQVRVQEPSLVDVDCAGAEVLVLEEDPHAHLPLVVLIAHSVEIIIHNLLQIVLFHLLQLLQRLFQLLFALEVHQHDSFLSLEDLGEEAALALDYFLDLEVVVVPVVDELGVVHARLLLELVPRVLRDQEPVQDIRSFALDLHLDGLILNNYVVLDEVALTGCQVFAVALHSLLVVPLELGRHSVHQVLDSNLLAPFVELFAHLLDDVVSFGQDENFVHLSALAQPFLNHFFFFPPFLAQEVPLLER